MKTREPEGIDTSPLPPPPPKIERRIKVGLTVETHGALIRCARLMRRGHTVLVREILEAEIPRRLAKLQKTAA